MSPEPLRGGAPLDRADLRQRVQKALDAFVARQLPALDGVSAELSPLSDALAELVSGGKRMRPAFCWWGYRGAGGADVDAVVVAAAAATTSSVSAPPAPR